MSPFEKRLDEIRKRLEAATPGPFKRGNAGAVWNADWSVELAICKDARDTDLIAHAPADIELLLRAFDMAWNGYQSIADNRILNRVDKELDALVSDERSEAVKGDT